MIFIRTDCRDNNRDYILFIIDSAIKRGCKNNNISELYKIFCVLIVYRVVFELVVNVLRVAIPVAKCSFGVGCITFFRVVCVTGVVFH